MTLLVDTSANLMHFLGAPGGDRIQELLNDTSNAILIAAVRTYELSSQSRERIPLVDSLIAACASLTEAALVHRDDQFKAIPAALAERADVEGVQPPSAATPRPF